MTREPEELITALRALNNTDFLAVMLTGMVQRNPGAIDTIRALARMLGVLMIALEIGGPSEGVDTVLHEGAASLERRLLN